MLDRESVDQGSITPSPPEIGAHFRGKLMLREGCLMLAAGSPRKAAAQGGIPLSPYRRSEREGASVRGLRRKPGQISVGTRCFGGFRAPHVRFSRSETSDVTRCRNDCWTAAVKFTLVIHA